MKITKLLLWVTCFSGIAVMSPAQDAPPVPEMHPDVHPEMHTGHHPHHSPVHFEVGLNALQVAKSLKGTASSDSLGLSPWLVDGRLSFRQFGIRGSAGGAYNSSKSYVAGFRDSDTKTIKAFNWRAGITYRQWLNRRFSVDFGLDWVMLNYSDEKVTDSGFDVIQRINQSTLTGGGVSVNTSWWITRHLSLGVEISYYYLTGKQSEARKFVNFPELDDQINNADITAFRAPASIFISYRL